MNKTRCVILFSGGSDSTAVSSMASEEFDEVHLLTYSELATRHSPVPLERIERLKEVLKKNFIQVSQDVDEIIQFLSYSNYFSHLKNFGLLNLATPGLSSLSWHTSTIIYCQRNGIKFVRDGLTRELEHLPGHADYFHEKVEKLYAFYGIQYESPIRNWPIPEDRNMIEKLILDYHWSEVAKESKKPGTSTDYLLKKGIIDENFYRGSKRDYRIQHDCYPFIIYNIFYFWFGLNFWGKALLENKLSVFFEGKFELAKKYIRSQL